jgi:hypothetical protein
MEARIYIEWHERAGKWFVETHSQVLGKFDTKQEAKDWVRRTYPGHGFDEERVVVREDSPKGAKRGQWL